MKSLFTLICCGFFSGACAQASGLVSRFEVSNDIDSFAERISVPEISHAGVADIFSANMNTCFLECGLVPVRLISLDAKRMNAQFVNVFWETANETNNKGFFVQRSLNILPGFSDVGFVAADHHQSGIHHYEFEDENDHENISFYRLKQIDLDGSFVYSKIVSVNGYSMVESIYLYPNPASQEIRVKVYLKKAERIRLCLYDNKGRKVWDEEENFHQGINTKTINIGQLPNSEYLITVSKSDTPPLKSWFIKN